MVVTLSRRSDRMMQGQSMQFVPFESGIEVLGQTLAFTVAGFRIVPSVAYRYLLKYGLATQDRDGKPVLDLDGWHSHDAWLQAFKAIHDEIGAPPFDTTRRRRVERRTTPTRAPT
ncbi:MAG: hypothetical protein ACMG6S_23095 [Byssovorax sp.]